MIHCLIIENDKKTIKIIKEINVGLEIYFDEVVEDQEIALNTILKTNPKIILLNIDSTKIDILELLFEVTQHCLNIPSFIALSSLKDRAFDSYKYGFLDFLLKPLSELPLRKSFLKYKKKHLFDQVKTICLKSYKDYRYLNIDDILYLKADNNTTDFFMTDGSIIGAYKTLKVFENLLPQFFLRIHKSYIVNRNCISRIHYGKSMCIINHKHKIPFTKTFITNINLIHKILSKNTIITLN